MVSSHHTKQASLRTPVFFSSPILPALEVQHGFFTRQGGVSQGLFTSLNTSESKGDNPEDVSKNLFEISQIFEHKPILMPKQIHGREVVVVQEEWSTPPEADAIITRSSKWVVGVRTADCVPLLIYDPHKNQAAAVHAGWKGAFVGVIENTLQELDSFGGRRENYLVAVGPCIHQKSYEVDQGFYESFLQKDPLAERFFLSTLKKGFWLFDLPGFVINECVTLGLKHIDQLDNDTYSHPDLFFSCRRAFHQNEPVFGNQLSAICLKR